MTCLAFPEFLCPFTERVYNIFHFLSFHFFLFTSFTRPVTLEKSGFFCKQMRLRSCLHRLVNKICKQDLKNFFTQMAALYHPVFLQIRRMAHFFSSFSVVRMYQIDAVVLYSILQYCCSEYLQSPAVPIVLARQIHVSVLPCRS